MPSRIRPATVAVPRLDLFPTLPPEGKYVDLPLLDVSTGLPYKAGQLELDATILNPEDPFEFQTAGIPYALLEVIGLTVQIAVYGQYLAPGFDLYECRVDGEVDVFYDTHTVLVPHQAYIGQVVANVPGRPAAGYRRYNVLGFRQRSKVERTGQVTLTGRVWNDYPVPFIPATTVPPIDFVLTAAMRCNVLVDREAEAGDVLGLLQEAYGDDVDLYSKVVDLLQRDPTLRNPLTRSSP